MDREPLKLLEERLTVCKLIRLENNSGKSVLNPLDLVCDIVTCTKENKVGIAKMGADESMSYK